MSAGVCRSCGQVAELDVTGECEWCCLEGPRAAYEAAFEEARSLGYCYAESARYAESVTSKGKVES